MPVRAEAKRSENPGALLSGEQAKELRDIEGRRPKHGRQGRAHLRRARSSPSLGNVSVSICLRASPRPQREPRPLAGLRQPHDDQDREVAGDPGE